MRKSPFSQFRQPSAPLSSIQITPSQQEVAETVKRLSWPHVTLCASLCCFPMVFDASRAYIVAGSSTKPLVGVRSPIPVQGTLPSFKIDILSDNNVGCCSGPSEWFASDRSQSCQIANPLGQHCKAFGHCCQGLLSLETFKRHANQSTAVYIDD